MSASAYMLQMVRAHYQRNEQAFAHSAMSLSRMAKEATVREQINTLIRNAYSGRPVAAPPSQMRPVKSEAGGMLQPLKPVTFDDLMLEPEIQCFIDEIVVELEYSEALKQRKLRPRSRLLFCGPPGNGKSSSAAAMGNALGVTAYGVSLPALISKYIGATGENLGQLFDSLRPDTLIVFDEVDALGARRGATDQAAGKESNSVVNTMLTLMDRTPHGIIVGTTNRPDILDPALLRRFDEVIEFPEPSYEQMTALAERLCTGFGVPVVSVAHCKNFDEVTKTVEREARRVVMREILAADAAAQSEEDTESESDDGDEKES